jgi:hypothetical protein
MRSRIKTRRWPEPKQLMLRNRRPRFGTSQKTIRLPGVLEARATPANNNFLLVSQFSVTGVLYACRPDWVGLANTLPLVVIELKKPGVPALVRREPDPLQAGNPGLIEFNALLGVSMISMVCRSTGGGCR